MVISDADPRCAGEPCAAWDGAGSAGWSPGQIQSRKYRRREEDE
jgi:hypothetical protein